MMPCVDGSRTEIHDLRTGSVGVMVTSDRLAEALRATEDRFLLRGSSGRSTVICVPENRV